jgi:hypothetical protein
VEIIASIAGGHLLAVVTHRNAARYPGQAMSLVEAGDYGLAGALPAERGRRGQAQKRYSA